MGLFKKITYKRQNCGDDKKIKSGGGERRGASRQSAEDFRPVEFSL